MPPPSRDHVGNRQTVIDAEARHAFASESNGRTENFVSIERSTESDDARCTGCQLPFELGHDHARDLQACLACCPQGRCIRSDNGCACARNAAVHVAVTVARGRERLWERVSLIQQDGN